MSGRRRAEPPGGFAISDDDNRKRTSRPSSIGLVAALALLAFAGLAQTGRVTVRPGDTLTAIAARNGVSPSALAQANGIKNPNLIVIGQTLTLPGAGSSPSTRTTTSASTASGIAVVQPGDTLAKISARTGAAVMTLIAANGLIAPYNLYSGGQLLLTPPSRTAPGKLSVCPVAGAKFMNDWGFTRSDTGFHRGNDMMAKRGTPVRAPVSGTVAPIVGSIGGNQFRLAGDNGTVYWGAHLDKFGKSGRVRAGDVIGYVGDTGDAKGGPTHLHFEAHPGGGNAVNPYAILVAACR